jgi:hypothetical protein
MPRFRTHRRARAAAGLALAATLVLVAGCFDEPPIEDRWTRLDFEGANLAYGQLLPTGPDSVAVHAAITFRRIVTGYAVVELRASSSLTAADVALEPTADRVRMAGDVDRVLASSVSLGRATRAVTGWDHLIQRLDLGFMANVPATLDTTGAPAGLFLVAYLASGDEVERADGTDTLIVTPMPSVPNQLLPIGLELVPAGPGAQR